MERKVMNVILYTEPLREFFNEKYLIEVDYSDKVSEILEFDTQVEQLKKYEELCK